MPKPSSATILRGWLVSKRMVWKTKVGENLRTDAAFVLELPLPGRIFQVHEIAAMGDHAIDALPSFSMRNPGPV